MRKRLGLALVLGLVLAVLVSACGVALGPVQFTAGGPAVWVPALSGSHMPASQPLVAPHTLNELQKYQISTANSLFGSEAISCHGLH